MFLFAFVCKSWVQLMRLQIVYTKKVVILLQLAFITTRSIISCKLFNCNLIAFNKQKAFISSKKKKKEKKIFKLNWMRCRSIKI